MRALFILTFAHYCTQIFPIQIQDSYNRELAPLLRRPYVKYAGPTGDYLDDCTFDKSAYPNVDDMFSVRVKRQDYVYDENLTAISYEDYEELSDYEKNLMKQYTEEEYDYSTFDGTK